MSNLARNWQLVRHTEGALRSGSENLGNVPGLLRALLEEEAWREFSLPNGQVKTHHRFDEFVAAQPPRGLGMEMAVIEGIIGTRDADLLKMLRAAGKVGQGHRTDLESESNDQSLPLDSNRGETGERSDYTAERLARDAPNVYAAVKAGELSINAAAVLAGIRPRRISVRTDDPVSLVNSVQRANPDVLRAVRDEIDRRLQ